MRFEVNDEDLGVFVKSIVVEVLQQLEFDREHLSGNGRLALTEGEAASRLGIRRHVLRDARLRNEIVGIKVGKKSCLNLAS